MPYGKEWAASYGVGVSHMCQPPGNSPAKHCPSTADRARSSALGTAQVNAKFTRGTQRPQGALLMQRQLPHGFRLRWLTSRYQEGNARLELSRHSYLFEVNGSMSQVRRQTAMLPRPNWGWQDAAACRGEDLMLFFGPDGERQPERDVRERKAKAVCASCPVRIDCLNYAVARPEKYGTWGGLNEDERSAERRRRMRRANAA
jgi:WhiB family transcriptional regulator, redox-sensing transcriptional regulator